uniref:hypothetical protein n=1 Tax=Pararhizobium sp. IMCC3301 TaxID=3067904 RepID=UPI0027414003|nr:hypothetical protein [Pararhizobium sp. IMCC3301]
MTETGLCSARFEQAFALTSEQEAFAAAYVASGHAPQAFRFAFAVPNEVADEIVWHDASAALANHDVVLRIMALQEAGSDDVRGEAISASQSAHRTQDADIRALTWELENARAKAMADDKGASTAVSATLGKARLLGLMADKREPAATLSVAIIDFAKMNDEPDNPAE